MEKISFNETDEAFRPQEVFQDDLLAKRILHLANEIQRPFWYMEENFQRYAFNHLKDESLSVAQRIFKGTLSGIGASLSVFLVFGAFALKGLSSALSRREFTYWEGFGLEKDQEKKVLHLNACMLPGGFPMIFGGMDGAGVRMEGLKTFIQREDPDIFFLSEFTETQSGKLFECFKSDYKHFFIDIGPNACGIDSSMAVVSKVPVVRSPRFFPTRVPAENEQKLYYRGYFHIETKARNYLYMHLHPGDSKCAKEIRRRQLIEIKAITEKESNGKLWAIVGDMNVDRRSDEYREVEALSLQDPLFKKYGIIETTTDGSGESIDGIWLTGGEDELSVQAKLPCGSSKTPLSDHLAIIASIS